MVQFARNVTLLCHETHIDLCLSAKVEEIVEIGFSPRTETVDNLQNMTF